MAFITNAEGNFFYQLQRSVPFTWLTCTGVGDIDIPQGDRTPVYCPDPLNSGRFKIEGFIRGDPGAGTYSLVKPLSSVYNWLLEQDCAFQGRINWVCRGNRMDYWNYEVAVIMHSSEASSRGIPTPVREPDGTEARVNTNMSVSFIDLMLVYRVRAARQTISNTQDAHGIVFLPQRCEDRCGPARGLCEEGIMGLEGVGAYVYESEIKKTHDGTSWAATPTDPYTWGGDTHAVLMFETLDGMRYLVFRSETHAGFPAECAYSDDQGTTWTNVAMGTVGNQAVYAAALCGAVVIAVCNDGYIYESYDQGATWAVQDAGVAAGGAQLNAVAFYDAQQGYAVGNGNVFLYTSNGGNNWYAGTGPAVGFNLLSVAINDSGHIFIGTNDGRMFRSEDDGDTWATVLDHGGGTIPWIEFDPDNFYGGYYIWNSTAPSGSVYRSEDGGAAWRLVPGVVTNSGLNSGHVCDINNAFVVGNVHGGTTFVAVVAPST